MQHFVFVEDLKDKSKGLSDSLSKTIHNCHFSVSDDDFVVIKVNLCDFRPAWEGCVTDVNLINDLIIEIRNMANPRIAIVESNHAVANVESLYERHGYQELAEHLGVELINLSKDDQVQIVVDGNYFKYKKFAKTLTQMTKFISVAVLKTHTQERITCILKNQFGFISQKYKSKYHIFLPEVLNDINNVFPPDLCIVDGRFAMEGSGPSDGTVRNDDIIIAGQNALAVDIACSKLMGFRSKQVPALKFAIKRKMINPKKVQIIGSRQKLKSFKFIPFYSYRTRHLGNLIGRFGIKINKIFSNIQEFLRLSSLGFLVLRQGYYISDRTVFRNDGFRFGMGMNRKFLFLYRKKILLAFILTSLLLIILLSILLIVPNI